MCMYLNVKLNLAFRTTQMALSLTFCISVIVMQNRVTGVGSKDKVPFSENISLRLYCDFMTLTRYSYNIF